MNIRTVRPLVLACALTLSPGAHASLPAALPATVPPVPDEVVTLDSTCGLPAALAFQGEELNFHEYECNLSAGRMFMRRVTARPGDLIERCTAIHNGLSGRSAFLNTLRPGLRGALKVSAYQGKTIKLSRAGEARYLDEESELKVTSLAPGETVFLCWISRA